MCVRVYIHTHMYSFTISLYSSWSPLTFLVFSLLRALSRLSLGALVVWHAQRVLHHILQQRTRSLKPLRSPLGNRFFAPRSETIFKEVSIMAVSISWHTYTCRCGDIWYYLLALVLLLALPPTPELRWKQQPVLLQMIPVSASDKMTMGINVASASATDLGACWTSACSSAHELTATLAPAAAVPTFSSSVTRCT
jgi:hypothetical protein